MKLILLLFVAFANIPVSSDYTPVRVFIVTPSGEKYTQEVHDMSIASVENAITWWEDLSPVEISLEIDSVDVITSTEDYYYHAIERGVSMAGNDHITVFIVNNTVTHTKLYTQSIAFSYYHMRSSWVLLHQPYGDSVDALVTHEFGHTLFDLYDVYLDDFACAEIDIMCEPNRAYYDRFIGCKSLMAIDRPCTKVFIPMLVNR